MYYSQDLRPQEYRALIPLCWADQVRANRSRDELFSGRECITSLLGKFSQHSSRERDE